MTLNGGMAPVLRYFTEFDSFGDRLRHIEIFCRCTCLLTSIYVTWSCHLPRITDDTVETEEQSRNADTTEWRRDGE